MLKKIFAILLLMLIPIVSVAVMVLPTFFTKNISRTELKKEINLPLILNSEKNIELLFFGYSGCVDICTPRLENISLLYESLDTQTKAQVGLKFLDISMSEDKMLPSRFAEYFHDDFTGIYLNKKIIRDYTKPFNVFFAPGLRDKTEFDHTAHLYIVKKSKSLKEIRFIYSAFPYDVKQIQLDIQELLNDS
ncbi:MAG: SCO family protein [Campylobacterota bacterium]|nr:SCO family protein [Campylobacterota bacterium]